MSLNKNTCGYRQKRSKKFSALGCTPRRGIKSPDFHRLRPRHKCLKVSDLVYKFLENVASVNAERRQRNNARTNFQRTHVRRYSRQCRRPDDPKTTDKIALQSGHQDSAKNTSTAQFVEDYVKTATKSKQRAERYVRNALAFGINTGFLLPTDFEKHVYRVSSALGVKIMEQSLDPSKEKHGNGEKRSRYREKRRNSNCDDCRIPRKR